MTKEWWAFLTGAAVGAIFGYLVGQNAVVTKSLDAIGSKARSP